VLALLDDATASPPPRALISPRKPHARSLLYFHHGLLAMRAKTAPILCRYYRGEKGMPKFQKKGSGEMYL